jgi:CspA family cold shock protein
VAARRPIRALDGRWQAAGSRRPARAAGRRFVEAAGGGGRRGPGAGRKPPARQTDLRIRHWGTVKWFDLEKGYGFIAQEDGEELFVHTSGIIAGRESALQEGQPVEYEIERTPRGPQAVDVVPLA